MLHFRGRTERLVLKSTASGEYVALCRGNTASKFVIGYPILWIHTTHLPLIHGLPSCGTHCHSAHDERTFTFYRHSPSLTTTGLPG
jgi:hypothetical protein